MMKKINLEKYIYRIFSLSAFYRYSKDLFENEGIRNEIKKQGMDNMLSTANSFKSLKIDAQTFINSFKGKIEENIEKNIDNSIKILRQQIIVSSHTIFENFLCNVVRAYLNVFPIILKEKNKSISFRDIIDLKNNSSILNFIIEKEVNDFSWLSLQEKKAYLSDRLKIPNQKELWEIDQEDLFIEIDKKRHSIVHDDNPVEITEEELYKYLYYFQRIIFGLSVTAKIYQGVDFIWENISEQFPGKEKPTLK